MILMLLTLSVFLFAQRMLLPAYTTAELCAVRPIETKIVGGALPHEEERLVLDAFAPKGFTMRPGDTVHEFETTVGGGLFVMRHGCYVGELVRRVPRD